MSQDELNHSVTDKVMNRLLLMKHHQPLNSYLSSVKKTTISQCYLFCVSVVSRLCIALDIVQMGCCAGFFNSCFDNSYQKLQRHITLLWDCALIWPEILKITGSVIAAYR